MIDGQLPNPQWLQQNKYSGLCYAIRKRPELFAHIPQLKFGKSPEEWVPIAEQLAKENGGTLQNSLWLRQNNYHGLYQAIYRNRELFKHVLKKPTPNKRGKLPEEWVPIAEQLAKENGGTLPHGQWLRQEKYYGLCYALRNHSELFKHIPQLLLKGKLPEEWVPIAEQLAKDNGGTLPNPAWLQKHNYSGLYAAIRKHKKLFKHIPQLRLAA